MISPNLPDKRLSYKFSMEACITLSGVLAILCHFIFKWAQFSESICQWPLILLLCLGGIPLLFNLVRKLGQREFGSDFLAGISIITAGILGQYLAGSIIVIMLSGGAMLEQLAKRRASNVLEALSKRMPHTAHLLKDAKIIEISLDKICVGDLVTVLPHETCPVDGTVVQGYGAMDESYLTGEPFQNSKIVGSQVFSGAINGQAALTVKVEKLPSDSRYFKIMQVMREAEANRPKLRRIADSLGAWFIPIALGIAISGWLSGNDANRFLAVLVIATPCPLLLAVPIAIMGAISACASRSIIIKNPAMLEQIDLCHTIIFDKTGTLTYGKPKVSAIYCAPTIERSVVIQLAASLEQYSKHPLSSAVLEYANQNNVKLIGVSEITETPGKGLRGKLDNKTIQIVGRKFVAQNYSHIIPLLPPAEGGMECILVVNDEYAALFQFRDVPRHESHPFIQHLKPKHNINRIMLVSGDREEQVRYLANEVGITEIFFSKSPEEKVEIVSEAVEKTPTLFLGDGINDAPAMQAATVGIAFGLNNNITAEAADAVIIETSLSKINELIHIGRRMRTIVLQTVVVGMALSTIGMLMAAVGYIPPVTGAIVQEIIDVLAVMNALRMAIPGREIDIDYA